MSADPVLEFFLNSAEWTEKGCDALVDGDIVRLADRPTVKDSTKPNSRGGYQPSVGADGRPVKGDRTTLARVVGISPTLGHPKAAEMPSMASGFYRSVYVEVMHSEGTDPFAVGQTTSFLQHNANRGDRQTLRWPKTGPTWPSFSTLRDRDRIVSDFRRTARHQREAIEVWAPMRAELERLAPKAGRQPKEILEELAPADIVVDPDATRLWVAKIWNGQTPLSVEQKTTLARLVRRIASQSDKRHAA